MTRGIVWKLADLPPKPDTQGWEVKLDDLARQPLLKDVGRAMGPLSEGQFGALLKFLLSFYGYGVEGIEPERDLSERRFNALINALVARVRRLEYDDPPEVMHVLGRSESTLRFYLVPAEVDRLTSGIIKSLTLLGTDERGREIRRVSDAARILYDRAGNRAEVEILRDGAWTRIDFYNPFRIDDSEED
jgi:hypothetical protein